MTEKGAAQWTYRQTPERKRLIDKLRANLDELYPDKGERQNGVITTAQIIDWALEDLELKTDDMKTV